MKNTARVHTCNERQNCSFTWPCSVAQRRKYNTHTHTHTHTHTQQECTHGERSALHFLRDIEVTDLTADLVLDNPVLDAHKDDSRRLLGRE